MMMRRGAITILCGLLVHCEVKANEHREPQGCLGRTTYFYPRADSEPISVNYDNDSNHCWMIYSPNDDYQVRIKFSQFNLTRGHDFLSIGDMREDEISENTLLAEFGGEDLPNDVISLSKNMWMKLSIQTEGLSSHRVPNIVFTIQAETTEIDINLPCPTASSYNLTYPLHRHNYRNNDYRLWRAKAEPPCMITLTMTSLFLEGGYDFVFVNEGDRTPFRRMDWFNFTGQIDPWLLSKYPYETEGSYLTIVFTSDSSKQKPGFSLRLVANSSDQVVDSSEQMITDEISTVYPTQKWPSSTRNSSSLPPNEFSDQGKKNGIKFYLIVLGISAIATAVIALLLVIVVRFIKLDPKTARPISWDTIYSVSRSNSTRSSRSLGRFLMFMRHHDETFSDSFSSGTFTSQTLSSGGLSRGSSLSNNYTSSLSSYYRSSMTLSTPRPMIRKDSLQAVASTPTRNPLTTFHPIMSHDHDYCVVDENDGTSSESDDENCSRRISWRKIRNAFWNGSSRSPPYILRSTSNRVRTTLGSTGSYVQDTDSMDQTDTSSSTDTGLIPTSRVAQRNSSRTMTGLEAEYSGRNQSETLSLDQVDGSQINQVVGRKITHSYFKGCIGQTSRSISQNVAGRPLPPIPLQQ